MADSEQAEVRAEAGAAAAPAAELSSAEYLRLVALGAVVGLPVAAWLTITALECRAAPSPELAG